mgnify:CR=1 FL=1
MDKIRVAIIGVGNFASATVQGIYYYEKVEREEATGLKHLFLGGYHPRDIELVAAFDIDSRKVGKDLSEAIFSPPNNTLKFAEVPSLDVPVLRGPILDGVGESLRELVKMDDRPAVDVAEELRKSGAEIVVNLLPGGAFKASEWYAKEAVKAGCAFVNANPTFISSDPKWVKHFEENRLLVVGDDLVDQVGATVLHRVLLKTLAERGVKVSETYQLDVGGGTESLDTLERAKTVKRSVKTKSVEAALPYKAVVVAGSTDYVDFLENRRDSYFWIEGVYFGGAPMHIDIRLHTIDAPNGGSVLYDVLRAVKIALNRGLVGALPSVSAYAFKNPPKLLPPETAEQHFKEFICGERER